jgi:hypothetical protein
LNARPEECDAASAKRPETPLELADHAALLELVHLDDGVQELEVVARVRRELLQGRASPSGSTSRRIRSLRGGTRADPTVEADALRDVVTSAPVASHTFAISLMKEIRVTRRRSPRASPSPPTARRSARSARRSLVQLRDHVAVGELERADHDAVGLHEVTHGRSLGGELRIRDVADVARPAVVEPVAHGAARSDRDGALHRDDDPPVDLRELVDDGPDRGEIGVAGVRRRRADRDVDDVGAVDGLARRPS